MIDETAQRDELPLENRHAADEQRRLVAAAEAAVGLAIIISLFRNRETLNVDEADLLKL